ncbi:diguanylate cyclase [Thalassotalea sp. 1_MG-2023]|uniref:diguanylate cyclase n=1 Tax=Thalassotalea sp. 1_MG-2023 TaxID=3062680 RepID=UPI0026E3F3C6|nr:diguanylate cyclase [Thalassotalea sp. 1_MG-2023]MDO6427256.1 diguanylate cyclase [Thalassotalea sp. 1_MG-2023]
MMKHAVLIGFYALLLSESFSLMAASSNTITIRYCIDPDWAPYESLINEQHVGLSRQYLSLIEQNANLSFTLVPTSNWQQTLEYIQTNKCDLIPMLNSTLNRKGFLDFTKVLFRAPNALYGHYNQPLIGHLANINQQSVAVVTGYRLHRYLLENYPEINIVEVENEAQGLEKVQNKEIDFYLGSFHGANKYIKDNALNNLRIVGISELEDKLRIGVSKSLSDMVPILNQAISQITVAEHAQVFSYLKEINTTQVKDYSMAIKSASAFSAVIICLLFGYWRSVNNASILEAKNKALQLAHQQLDDKNKQLADLAIRDSLTRLYNRGHLSECIQQQIKLKERYNKDACLLILDIDDFKQINDQFGHKIGDDVLQYFAMQLTECARNTDIVARWGGEEFVILCPETNIDEAKIIAKRFQQCLFETSSDDLPCVTCSIGIAPLRESKSADQWFIAADNAMYQAKELGKDTIFTIDNA